MADIFQVEIDSIKNEETENDKFLQMNKRSIGRYIPRDETTESECASGDADEEKRNSMSNEIEIDFENFFLDELEELANSDYIHNRQLAAKKILDSLQKAGSNKEEYQSIISVMCKLSEDEESMVRSELVQHIPSIALFCQNHPELKLVISQQLVPYTVKLLNDNYISVRKLAQTALLVLLENNLIGQLQLSEWICPLVAQLAMCANNHDELRIEDVTVMSLMIPLVENSLTIKFFLDPYISLCCDKVMGIRTVCAMRFGTLCKVAGLEITETSLLPAFLDLCKDVAWGVRKACANVFVEVANAVSLKTRKEVLSATLLKLLDDSSNSVRLAAYQSLGAFICSFADPNRTGFVCENGKLNCVKVDESKQMEFNINGPIAENLDNLHIDHKEDVSHPADHSTTSKENTTVDSLKMSNSIKSNNKELSDASTVLHSCLRASVIVTTKNNSSSDDESAFNNFQFWREPLPDVDVNINEESTKNSPAQSGAQDSQEAPSYMELFLEELQYPKVNYSDSKYNSLEDDAEIVTSSFKESILTFKTEDLCEQNAHSCFHKRRRSVGTNAPNDLLANQDIVPNEILMKYFEALMSKSIKDDQLNAACAFSFPAVTYTLGRKYWPCLRATFQRVTKNVQSFSEWRNRCAIASSLPQLANMLGHDIIMEDLLPKFLEFLTDVDEVRQSVVLQIPDFLQHVPSEERYQFFVHIEDFLDDADSMKWRFRCCVAEQLSATLKLCNPYNVEKYFLPVALTLLQDRVFAVRLAAAEFMANIVKHILDSVKMPLLSKLDITYRQAHKWNQRQTYVLVCEQLAKQRSLPVDTYVTEIVPRLFSLAWDVVPNVRLAVSRCIALTLLPLDYLPAVQKAHSDLFLQVYYSLQSDIDDDVRHYGLLCARAYSAPSYENKIVWSSECI
ncbi:serine/threonine-protein phosphatase 4 regulatory subunit 1-like isoform X1 [Argiope bruennichi]|uniref:serine/threonine-protein phosphatase 4 regulatory subunit 1-like isoform X1 n=2 Tax=Argiope bruennichi TaxID=94029 RepID=UPI0024953C89|nr:serine/threonine-protein phosphatase 4 regulatory subunit 1-like isoform X1 [Argiope bruennichi]